MEHIQIGMKWSPEENETYTALFKQFHNVFTSSYEEMPGIDPWIITHEIQTYLRARLV